jgi:hypothetical protein
VIDSNWLAWPWPGLGLALVLDGCVAELWLMMAMMVMCSHGFPLFVGFVERKMSRKHQEAVFLTTYPLVI